MTDSNPAVKRELRRVLIVTKKTTYHQEVIEGRDPHLVKMVKEGHDSAKALLATHTEHHHGLVLLKGDLSRRGIEVTEIDRGQLASNLGDFDLVISFGGDGTFLETSHFVGGKPLLGFNSATFSSHGHWCLANAGNFVAVIDDMVSGNRNPLTIPRLAVSVNGKPLDQLVINEVLICHPSPGGTSRYHLEVRGKREQQRSSGVIIGPACGSTGFMRSAGGTVLPVYSDQFQVVVREPCIWPGEVFDHLKLILERTDEVKVIPVMAEGKVFIDGQHNCTNIVRGDEVVVRAASNPLTAYVTPGVNDAYMKS